ncbi:tyrosine-protein phosphatase [Sporolactobacillus laevolacticus]|uniref:Tyrosine-protein phosphatase n=1 Tax=Sporolactobacillus laevolacticus DSM 442 TaxID=1395513 RepID=V6IYV2_9BACL|nr:CpsB/CapC family capsule biosynthesis tyrosine phosphatase [Sporolactobacillus laevolacticus]EST12663.1 tyrosine protein phosphatase [Sporolactobacillus laevolacticus DSM 442]
MIDIHCHILPGIDDGAQDEKVSLAMAEQAVAQGITQIVATPHHKNRHWDNPGTEIRAQVQALNQLFKQNQIGLQVLPGQEPRIFGEMAQDGMDQELMTINDNKKYILIEFPTHHVPRYAQQLFFDLQVKGLTPVIVHPERNEEIVNHPNILYGFITDGALSQVTADSLIGKNGRTTKKRTLQFIEHNLSQFVASDAHNVTTRPFYMQEAFLELKKQFGRDLANQFRKNAEMLINGELINRDAPVEIKEKKFFGIF